MNNPFTYVETLSNIEIMDLIEEIDSLTIHLKNGVEVNFKNEDICRIQKDSLQGKQESIIACNGNHHPIMLMTIHPNLDRLMVQQIFKIRTETSSADSSQET